MPRTIFRVFLSSTFGDFQAEREKLRAEVWPRLEALCAAHGASFHVVDLRWGISPSVATTHDTIQICLDEVIRCQQLSPRPKPNFLMLIGDRYGWRPPAVEISAADFRLIKKAVSSKDAAFLLSWYRKDTNAVPPVWCLKPRTDGYANYEAWGPVESRITAIFHEAAEKLGLSPEKYLYSATHMEIASGLLQLEGAQDHIFSFNRELRGLPDSAPKGIARRFADYLPEGTCDPEAKELLEVLKQQIADVLPATQIHTFQADWLGNDDTPISTDHIDKFCSDVETSLLSVIRPELEEIAAVTPLQEELELQRQFLQETGSLLIGRGRELKRIRAYLGRKKTPLPLIIRATGGCGKSALMAKAVMEQEEESTLIYRFIGAAPRSWQPLTFLEDLIQQIAEAYGQEPPPLPEEGGIKKVAELFHEQLELATEEQPLTIFIDAIDQFSATSPVQFADLFPRLIPPNVTMVISVLEGKDSEQFKSLYPKAPGIQLEPLTANACGKILDALLQGRKLTKEQRSSILAKSKVNGLPLWLTLAAPIARKLKSWDTQPDLPSDIKELARYVIKRIADKHGHAITTASLRYIKLARFGLSETELQEILWADSDVRAEFDATRNPDQPEVDALPPVFWSRLYAELDPYINEYWMDGQLLHRYFHRVFGEVADEMDGGDTRKKLHSSLAEYFGQQALYNDLQPNRRKLMEELYHLVESNRFMEAQQLLTNFDYCMAKCELNRSDDLLEGYNQLIACAANANEPLNQELFNWHNFFQSKLHLLRSSTEYWPAHKILLQLAAEYADDSSITKAAEKFLTDGKCFWPWLRRNKRLERMELNPCVMVFGGQDKVIKDVHSLPDGRILSVGSGIIRIWNVSRGICLVAINDHIGSKERDKSNLKVHMLSNGRVISWSSQECTCRIWDDKSGVCLALMEGHTKGIANVQLLQDGRILTWSYDKTVRIWDDLSGRCLAILVGHTDEIDGVRLLKDGRILSWTRIDGTLRIWDDQSGTCLITLRGHSESVDNVQLLNNGHILSSSLDGTLRVWDDSNGDCLAIMEGHSYGFSIGTLLLKDERILSWSEDDGTLHIWDNQSGACLITMDGHSEGIHSAPLIMDGRILSWSEDATLRIWDEQTGANILTMKGHTDGVRGARLLKKGRILSWSIDYTLRIWDGQNGKCFATMVGHTDQINGTHILNDGRILSWSADGTIRIWSDKSGICLGIMKGHTDSVDGTVLLSDGRLLSWSSDIRIWDITLVTNKTPDSEFAKGHKQKISGIVLLPGGLLLSGDIDDNLCLWDANSNLLKTYQNIMLCDMNSVDKVPIESHGHEVNIKGYYLEGREYLASVLRNEIPILSWYSESFCHAHHLTVDGTAIVSQENGQVCFLQTYLGDKLVKIEELQ